MVGGQVAAAPESQPCRVQKIWGIGPNGERITICMPEPELEPDSVSHPAVPTPKEAQKARELAEHDASREKSLKRIFPGQGKLPIVSVSAGGGFVVGGVENSKHLTQGLHPYTAGATVRVHPWLGRSVGLMAGYRTWAMDAMKQADGSMVGLPNAHGVHAGASGRVLFMGIIQAGLDVSYEYFRGTSADDAGVQMPLAAHSFGVQFTAQIMFLRRFGIGWYAAKNLGPRASITQLGAMASAGF